MSFQPTDCSGESLGFCHIQGSIRHRCCEPQSSGIPLRYTPAVHRHETLFQSHMGCSQHSEALAGAGPEFIKTNPFPTAFYSSSMVTRSGELPPATLRLTAAMLGQARLVLPPENDATELLRLLERHRIGTVNCSPSAFSVLLEESQPTSMGPALATHGAAGQRSDPHHLMLRR